ncbi:MAG: phosphoglycerate kinase [Candidatus Aenigmatarchaeota archaeon]
MNRILKFQDFDFKGKTVALRVDLNLPYDPKAKKLSEGPRLSGHLGTIKALSKAGAKIVILAHQGRKGNPDFIPLRLHARLLEKKLGKKVRFLKFGASLEAVKKMKPCEIILLDNVRFYEDEIAKKTISEHSKSALPESLGPLIDCFVLDAFSVAHRSHASVVGFCGRVPCIAGPVFLKEYEFLTEFLEKIRFSENDIFILGGAKPDEPINLLERLYKKGIEKILTTGVISLLLLKARGYDLGKTEEFLEKKGYLAYMKKMAKFAKESDILAPIDLAVERNGKRAEIGLNDLPAAESILDIGKKTIEIYGRQIRHANIICMKGPAGMYEKKDFAYGTKSLFEEIVRSESVSLIGGGNSTDAMKALKIPPEAFTYVSLSGGAFVEFLSGVKLPGVEAFNMNKMRSKNG